MRRRRTTAGAVVAALVLAGCGSASEEYETTGVDELVIPTPSPDPSDFVARVDNPLLPLEQGSTWTYSGTTYRTTVDVVPSDVVLDGVEVTEVRTVQTPQDNGDDIETTDYYAQDRDGNVWWFGRAGVWDVTVPGAEAGLAMPADPRVGDGWRRGLLEGIVEDRLTVQSVDGDTVVLQQASDLEPGVVLTLEYDAGYGLVRSSGPTDTSELVSGP